MVTKRVRERTLPGAMAIPGGYPELYLLEEQQPWGQEVGSGEEEEGEDLTSNYFKRATITTLTELKKSFTKGSKGRYGNVASNEEYQLKKWKFSEKNQMEILELKSIVIAMKN